MDRDEAIRQLRLGSTSERLPAARFFPPNARRGDITALKTARDRDPDAYVISAIELAIRRLTADPNDPEPGPRHNATFQLDETQAQSDAYALAIEQTTLMLVHELRRFVGLV